MKARIWKDDPRMGGYWLTDIPACWNPEAAYEFLGDPDESPIVGIYGLNSWPTFQEALDVVSRATHKVN